MGQKSSLQILLHIFLTLSTVQCFPHAAYLRHVGSNKPSIQNFFFDVGMEVKIL